jgi:hypothetical protein
MSTARYRTALAFICFSLAAALVWAGDEPADPAALELEVSLARRPQLYLMVDLGRHVVEVKVRGMVMDRAELEGAAVVVPGPLIGTVHAPEVDLPAVWRVAEPPEDLEQRVIAPEALRPYSEEEAEAPEPTPTASPMSEGGPVLRNPGYGMTMANGWRLEIGPGVATTGFFERVGLGLADVWRRVTGTAVERPPILALELAPADADRLHHLFRRDTAVLIVPAR